jgi:hypothetical protein
MIIRNLVAGVAVALAASGCATHDPMPFAAGKDCFYPACVLDVAVVDDGKGGKTLKVDDGGNVRMGTRHRMVAIVWNLKTPGYEFRGNSLAPHSIRTASGTSTTGYGLWSQEFLPHGYWYDSISVTNQNTQRGLLTYDLTVYPSPGTPGDPLTLEAGIMNDPCIFPGTVCR